MTERQPARSRPRGRPSALTPATTERVIDLVAEGNYLSTACAGAGVARSTLYGWLARAEDASRADEAGLAVGRLDRACLDFRTRLAEAQARAEARAVEAVTLAMRGGSLVWERPVLTRRGAPVSDEEGNLLYERKYAPPDGRLALLYLARAFRERWGSGAVAAGADVAVPSVSSPAPSLAEIRSLAGRLHQVKSDHDSQSPPSGETVCAG